MGKKINIEDAATKAVEKFINQIPNIVVRELNSLLPRILGFERDRCNDGWGIDHCNGRAGETLIGDIVREMVRESAKEWAKTVTWPTLSKSQEQAVIKEYKDYYMNRLMDLARNAGDADALLYFKELVKGKIKEVIEE